MTAYQLFTLSSKRCHCDGTGIVLIDGERLTGSVGEPCPMCLLGHRRAMEIVSELDVTPPPLDLKDPRQVRRDVLDTTNVRPKSAWRNRDGQPIDVANYYEGVSVHELTWNNGLTVYDRYDCANRWCPGWTRTPRTECRSCAARKSGRRIPRFADIVAQATGQVVRSALTSEEREALRAEIAAERAAQHEFDEAARGDDYESGAA